MTDRTRGVENGSEPTADNTRLTARTGQCVECRVPRPPLRAEIRSDFDHRRRVTLEDREDGRPPYQEARDCRHQRTGSILLPILDRDVVGEEENFYDEFLTPVCVRPSEPEDALPDGELVLECVQGDDRDRVAVHDREGTHIYGSYPNHTPLAGDLVRADADSVRIQGNASPNGADFLMCATTLAGDPRRPEPTDPSPPQSAENAPADLTPGEVWLRLGRQQEEEPSPKRRRTESPTADEVALFQIAPVLLQSNLEPARRLYVVSNRETHNFVYDVMEACWDAFGPPDDEFDHDFNVPFPPSTPGSIGTGAVVKPGKCVLDSDEVYLIDGAYHPEDVWAQDQMTTGYCSAPGGRSFNVAVQCKRERRLAKFVKEEMAENDVELFTFDGLRDERGDSLDYGGNIAASPPVNQQTAAHNNRQAGPPVPEHPPAPHGKIILGDCRNPNREGGGVVHNKTRNFLESQEMQPIVPIDTSWLAVGHVDEIMAFVPSPESDGPAKLAMASPDIMTLLLAQTMKVPLKEGRTHLHRGRHREHNRLIDLIIKGTSGPDGDLYGFFKRDFNRSYDETSVEDLFSNENRQFNHQIQTGFLRPIEHRICRCTGLAPQKDVLPLPVYFDCVDAKAGGAESRLRTPSAEARTSNLVNMQVLQTEGKTHLLVPRPCGPRLPPKRAKEVVESVVKTLRRKGINVPLPPNGISLPQDKKDNQPGFPFWAWPNLEADTLALYFTREKPNGDFVTSDERRDMINIIKEDGASLDDLEDESLVQAVRNTLNAILAANGLPANGDPAEMSIDSDSTDAGLFAEAEYIHDVDSGPDHHIAERLDDDEEDPIDWNRLFIPEDTVDVLEAYTQSVLEGIGCHVHFVDSWYHHTGHGEVHCATNVLREPPTDRSWWNDYPDLADANTTYDPNDTMLKQKKPSS